MQRFSVGLVLVSISLAALGLLQIASATEPAKSVAKFVSVELKVPDGFTVELAAAPPLVAHPTMACFDDRGRLYVSENAGVNLSAADLEKELPNSVRMLEDTDGNGRFDRSTVFADKMTFPMGGAWYRGSLYVAAPPNVWRLQDTTGDGVADRREILVNKFGYTGNAASVHGCFAGPDGRIYWCDGRHGHEFRDKDGKLKSKRAGSYIFSCRPNGSDVRIHCGGGMDNPVEVDFTNEGDVIGTVNIFYSRPRVDCLVHWLHGGAYPHYERVLGELKRTGDLLGPIHHFGHVAISGTMRYRGTSLDPHFRNNYFATFFNIGKVVRLELERDRSSYRVTQREFLSAANQDFHPTDVLEDPDGSLLVVDTGGWFYRGCPTSQVAKPDVLGAIYRIRRKGAKPVADPLGLSIKWEQLAPANVAKLLDDARPAVSERAIVEFERRGSKSVGQLALVAKRGSVEARRNAVWALTRIVGVLTAETPEIAKLSGAPGTKPLAANSSESAGLANEALDRARTAIRAALDDSSTSVQQTACRSLATYPDVVARRRLQVILKSDASAVRREAATALGRIGDARSVPELLSMADRDIDRSEQHAIVYALIEINKPRRTAEGLTSDSPAVRQAALIAIDQMDGGELTAKQVAPLLDEPHDALRRAALQIVLRHPDWAEVAGRQLSKWLASAELPTAIASDFRSLAGAFISTESVRDSIGSAFTSDKTSGRLRKLLLETIADGNGLPLQANWEAPLNAALDSKQPEDLQLALAAVSAIKTDRFSARLKQLGADSSLPTITRVAAFEAAGGKSSQVSDPAFELLLGMLIKPESTSDATQAARTLGGASLSAVQLLKLAPQLGTAGSIELVDLIRPFGRNASVEVGTAFLDAIESARSLGSLSMVSVSEVVKRYPAELRPRANQFLAKLKQQDDQQIAQIDVLLPLLKTGDAKRGEDVFFSKMSKCATCHKVGSRGERIGPDLSTIGANRSPHALLESIVLPSASLVREYKPFTIVTTAGKSYSGLIARETADTVYVQPATGQPVAIPRDEIDELTPSTVSIMPNGLEKSLTKQQLADVIAWLSTLK
ncbi:MAG: HEAT repeat domain-containing protein [Planctomycetota bacterium]|nr:HEAT repeat domain-containing protein [Planctomycetota bacterium]